MLNRLKIMYLIQRRKNEWFDRTIIILGLCFLNAVIFSFLELFLTGDVSSILSMLLTVLIFLSGKNKDKLSQKFIEIYRIYP